jgi:hypothetical protein
MTQVFVEASGLPIGCDGRLKIANNLFLLTIESRPAKNLIITHPATETP